MKDEQSQAMLGGNLSNLIIIYVAEGDHGDLRFSSLVKQIAETCIEKDLKFMILSEFKDQNEKLQTQAQALKNKPDEKTHQETTQFLNQHLTPMGDLRNRFVVIWPSVLKDLPDDTKPSMVYEKLGGGVDNPETQQLLAFEIQFRKENQLKGCGIEGEGDSPGRSGKDVMSFCGNGNAFVQKIVHKEMAQDVVKKLKQNQDTKILIVFAGTAHIYGVNKELENLDPKLQYCQKLVVGMFSEESIDFEKLTTVKSVQEAMHKSGKESCQMVGDVVSFECDEKDSTKAIIPSEIITLIKGMAQKNAVADIAEEANKTLEREKNQESSEEVVSSQGSPNSSPQAQEQPPLSAAKNPPPQDFHEAQIKNAKRMKMERASPRR